MPKHTLYITGIIRLFTEMQVNKKQSKKYINATLN